MKNVLASFIFAIALLTTSCAPRVGTMIIKTYPELEKNTPVEIYTNKKNVPVKSESLGIVSVGDAGLSTNCDSLSIVSIIKDKTRLAGGNAALITEHIRPSFWRGSCHQMTATILRVGDVALAVSDNNADSSMQDIGIQELKVIKPDRKLPRYELNAGGGLAWRMAKTSNSLSGQEKDVVNDLKSGMAWGLSFNYFFNDYMGLGLDYSNYRSSSNIPSTPVKNQITYVGPAYIARLSSDAKWLFNLTFGLGYIGYSSSIKGFSQEHKITGSSIGGKWGLGAAYKLSKQWGIGVDLSLISGVLSKLHEYENGVKVRTHKLEDKEKEGLAHFTPTINIRYYIK